MNNEASDYDIMLQWMVAKVPLSIRGTETDPRKILDKAYERQKWQIRQYERLLRQSRKGKI